MFSDKKFHTTKCHIHRDTNIPRAWYELICARMVSSGLKQMSDATYKDGTQINQKIENIVGHCSKLIPFHY